MDMNKKSRFGIKNTTRVAASLMKKFILVLAVCVMMAATAHAGEIQPFLNDSFDNEGVSYDGADDYTVYNRSRSDVDSWNSNVSGYTSADYTGFYIGTFADNDSETDLLNLIRYFLNDENISLLGYVKVDEPSTNNNNSNLTLDVTYDYGNKSGEWTVEDTNSGDPSINFYSVKAANEYALYYVDPAQSSGSWTTAHLLTGNENNDNRNQPEISHLSVARITDTPGIDPIPEPATMLMFGVSLIGLAGLARQRNGRL